MKQKKKKQSTAILAAVFVLVLLTAIIVAYFASRSGKKNEFEPGKDVAELTEKHKPPDELQMKNQYPKAVWVENQSNLAVYVRVYVGFTDSAVMQATKFSNSAATKQEDIPDPEWYFAAPENDTAENLYYKNHPPANWVYEAIDDNSGYYYYTLPLAAEDDPKTKDVNEAVTTTLFRWVNTTFENPSDIEAYGILLYYDSIQAYDEKGVYIPPEYTENGVQKNDGYKKAWALW